MRIYIDADGCPVVDLTLQVAKDFGVEAIIVCDTSHQIEREGVQTITVSTGADSVDFVLVNLLNPGDVAITQDYGLAAMCLARGAVPVSQDGVIYDAQNIDSLLLLRHIAHKLRAGGTRIKGPGKRTAQQDRAFAEALTAVLGR